MAEFGETLGFVLLLAAAGAAAGGVMGLLGVGGGVALPAALYAVLAEYGAPDASAPIAAASALAVNTILAAHALWRSGRAAGVVAGSQSAPPAVEALAGLGALLGAALVGWLGGSAALVALGAAAAGVALYRALSSANALSAPKRGRARASTGPSLPAPLAAALAGAGSAASGIGAGGFAARAVHEGEGRPSAALTARLGLVIGAAGVAGFFAAALFEPTPASAPPMSAFGFSLAALIVATPAAMIAAPVGARLARMTKRQPVELAVWFLMVVAGLSMLREAGLA